MAKKKMVKIDEMDESVAREVVKAVRERQETLVKLAQNCVREGQVAAAQKISGSVKDLAAVIDDIENQLEPVADGAKEEEDDDEPAE